MIATGNPRAQYLTHREEILRAVGRVLDGGTYILGAEVRSFEAEFAAYCGAAHGVGLGSGTGALTVALKALDIGGGDEVITVAHTAVATLAAIECAGARPVCVDIDPTHYTMDPDKLEAAVTPRTRAVLPVHLYGQPADMAAILAVARRHGLFVVEDCAQAAGADIAGRKVGTFGDIGCFSFYPTKNLGAIGDGGMAVTNDAALAQRIRALRQYGWNDDRISEYPGLNSRLDELQAAVLRVKLRHLDAGNARRRDIAAAYDRLLAGCGVDLPARRDNASHVFHLYVVECARREAVMAALARRGILGGVHYDPPAHRHPAYEGRVAAGPLPHTERAAARLLSLPIYPELDDAVPARVAEAVGEGAP